MCYCLQFNVIYHFKLDDNGLQASFCFTYIFVISVLIAFVNNLILFVRVQKNHITNTQKHLLKSNSEGKNVHLSNFEWTLEVVTTSMFCIDSATDF